jgi:hypothetical protein
MKNKLFKYIHCVYILCIALISIQFASCEKDMEAPKILSVRNYAASPNDTIVNMVSPGQWVVLEGENLDQVSGVYFGSVPALINNTYFKSNTIVIQIPDIPFVKISRDKLNEITVVNSAGSDSYPISLVGAPIITAVRNYEPAPNDTILTRVLPGQHLNIVGYNLQDISEISFQGVLADLTDIAYTDSSVIVKVPSDLSGSLSSVANKIMITSKIGAGTFSIKIIGPPVIVFVSNENPIAGDSVYVYGYNLTELTEFSFAGTPITEFKELSGGNVLGFVAPELSNAGAVKVRTDGGSFTTVFNVNDVATGRLSDLEWDGSFQWDWWAATLSVVNQAQNEGWITVDPRFIGNKGKFLVVNTGIQASGAGQIWESAVRIPSVKWIQDENLADPVENWALKFEMNVPNDWNGSSLCITPEDTEQGTFMVRLEPWQVSETRTAAYKTRGWITVVVPLSEFRLGDGKGSKVANLKDLLGDDGASKLYIYPHNYGTEDTKTGFLGGFDNFRVVR